MKRSILLLLLLIASEKLWASDLDTVREQFEGYYTAAGADPASARMRKALSELESVTRQITGPGWLRTDGSWYDIDYTTEPGAYWGPWDHSRRLLVMAKAYRTPGQELYGDETLRTQIDAALEYALTFYGPLVVPQGNWWFWTIGIPLDLGPTLVLMQGDVRSKTFDDLTYAMRLRIGDSPTKRGLVGPVPVGQNLVWSSFTHLCYALIRSDADMLASVREAMTGVVLPTTGEGIQPDWSFHQHGAQLYTGGYGGSFANDVARHALVTQGTSYGLSAESLAAFADYVADGIAWSLYGDHFDVSVMSREVSRPTTTGYNGVAALVQASSLETARTPEIAAAAAKMLESWNGTMPSELAALAAGVEAGGGPAAWPSGHRHYFASDYTVHRREGWFASIKMFSRRIKSGENTNNENRLGARQSDGRLYLVLRGDEYFGGDTWPALDWSRLPGTTVELKAGTAGAEYGYGSRTLAGGTGDGRNGVSAMDLAPIGSDLTARKSWIFFDDAIVFLTNGITAASTNPVETIVNQWPLASGSSTLIRKDGWALLDRIGYWFPGPAALRVTRETRTGTWAALGASGDTSPRTRELVTLAIDHGRAPMNDTAEYVIVPGVSEEAMTAWAAAAPVSIVANNESVSAARDNRTGALGIAFWRAAALEGIESSSAAVVFAVPEGNRLHIDAADPNGGTSGTFQLVIPGSWRTTDVAWIRTASGTMLVIPRNGGRTTSVTLERGPSRRRAASSK